MSDCPNIPHDRLTARQKVCDDPPAGEVPPPLSGHMLGLPAPSGDDRVGMEAIGNIPQRLTWRCNPASERGDTGGLFDN